MPKDRIAIVGAGISGLTCAKTLIDHGLDVSVYDKGFRPGGRLATRRTEVGEYDHGAQYFTVRDPRFERRVESWLEDGLVAEWKGRFISVKDGARQAVSETTRRYVGVPEMNSVAAHLAADCQIRTRLQVSAITRQGRDWALRHEHGEDGPFDFMILAVPAPQAVPLLAASPRMQSQVAEVRMNGCWAVLLGLDAPLEVGFEGAFVNEGPLSWIARNRSKPGRQTETWVLHASYAWTEQHLESEPDRVSDRLVEAFQVAAEVQLPEPAELRAHRWRYAIPATTLSTPCVFDGQLALAVCGDWCGGPRVEGAFLSGSAAAGRVLEWLGE